jgi:hypothetical protein
MSQQLFSRYPADVVEHGKLGAHLALLMPPLAALLYPFLLAAFHATSSAVCFPVGGPLDLNVTLTINGLFR